MTAPFPSKAHERLDVFCGTWDTTITMLNADGSDGEVSNGTDVYQWTSNGHFLRHDVDAEMDGRAVQSIEIIAVNQDAGGYTTRSFDADGTINDFTATLGGNAWSISGAVQRFAGTFSDDRQILSGKWEQRQDGRWLPLLTVALRKRAPRPER